MALDFSHITNIVIPEGSVKKIVSGGVTLWKKISEIIREFMGYPIQTAYSLAGDSINWKLYGNTVQEYAPVTSDDETNYPSELIGWATTTFNGSEDWKTGSSLSSTIYVLTTDLGVLRNSSANRRIYNENYITADTLPSASDRGGYVLRGNSASDSWIGFGEIDNYTPTTWKAYLTSHPQTVLFPLHISDNSVWKAVKRMSDNKFGYLCVSGNEKNTFIIAKGLSGTVAIPTPSTPIDILSVGEKTKNLFDLSKAVWGINIGADGAESSSTASSSSNYILCESNTDYTISFVSNTNSSVLSRYHEYDGNGDWLRQITTYTSTSTGEKQINFTTGNDAKYIRFTFRGGTPEKADLSTNIQCEKGSTATSYVPYGYQIPIKVNGTVQSTIYSPTPLSKVGAYADYIDYENQRIVRNCKVLVLDGTENWADQISTNGRVYLRNTGVADNNILPLIISHGLWKTNNLLNTWRILGGALIACYTQETTLQDFKSWLADQYANGTPVTVVYPLATSTTESLTVPNITLSEGTNIITTDTQVKPSDGYIKCNCSR